MRRIGLGGSRGWGDLYRRRYQGTPIPWVAFSGSQVRQSITILWVKPEHILRELANGLPVTLIRRLFDLV